MAVETNRMLAWLRLLRISALPSAVANILVGFLVAHGSWEPVPNLLLLIATSSCLYLAGMVSNDVFDVSYDRATRSKRPIASGAIPVRAAIGAYTILMVIAASLGTMLGRQTLVLVLALVVCIFLYNGVLKRFRIAPVFMGLCRTLNILLGASTVPFGEWPILVWWLALSIGLLVCGITYLARNEASGASGHQVLISGIVLFSGIGAVAVSQWIDPECSKLDDLRFPLLVVFISVPIALRSIRAFADPSPVHIKLAVISALRSLIFFDAAVCFLVAPENLFYCLGTASLIIPSMILSRLIPPT